MIYSINVKVEFAQALQNEFDILMMKDNHLHVIECKLRKSVPGEDYVYKLDSVIDYLDDDDIEELAKTAIKEGYDIKQFLNYLDEDAVKELLLEAMKK